MDSKEQLYKRMFLFAVFFSLMLFPYYSQADYQTNLFFSGYIQSGTVELDAGSWSAPTVYDWNSDGKKDLLIGQSSTVNGSTTGKINFFENIGTDSNPLFTTSSYIQSCSESCTNITVPIYG
jgi:hypothetical protein